LGEISRQQAMAQFVTLLDRVCPPFREIIATFAQQKQIKYVLNFYFRTIFNKLHD
jgi:hypothetical protein